MSKKLARTRKMPFLYDHCLWRTSAQKKSKMFDSFNEFSFPKTHLKFRFVYLKDCERF